MNNCVVLLDALHKLECLLLKQFKEEPFHNLFLLYGKEPLANSFGGTCSDKTLSFVFAARSLGFNAALHTGYIGGKEIHRLARITIENRVFFADVGNGWPALKLYPSDEEISFTNFGMRYRTEITNERISVFHTRNGKEFLQLEIDPLPRKEEDVKRSIAQRFSSGVSYPFSNSLRFSLVVGNQFLFLRDERLEIYSDNEFIVEEGIKRDFLHQVLKEHFNYEYAPLFEYLTSIHSDSL